MPGTLLHNLVDPSLRAWDFVSGEPFTSLTPTVFSYSDEPRYNKRDFLEISMAEERQPLAFAEPAPDVVLGMGANAIVLRIALEASRSSSRSKSISAESEKKPPPSSAAAAADGAAAAANGAAAAADGAAAADARPPKMRRLDTAAALESVPQVSRAGVTPAVKWWDAAVKRSFSLPKMLAMIGADSEASAARRLRFAGVLNDEGRLLHFYGLGLAVASSCADRQTFHFEAVLLSQFDDRFSTYTLKRFMENYMALTENMDEGDEEETAEKARVVQLQRHFSIIHVKELLESLLDGFRDLTRAGVQSFDFNHLSNVLISRDYRKVGSTPTPLPPTPDPIPRYGPSKHLTPPTAPPILSAPTPNPQPPTHRRASSTSMTTKCSAARRSCRISPSSWQRCCHSSCSSSCWPRVADAPS